jgi:oxalate decarboxylase/phosphoglucose isomerase-like protein (cupin superfamily)
MAIKVIKPMDIALAEKQRTKVFNSRKAHAWVHYYPNPGDHDELHCHNADQVFMCIDGQCTMTFPDGGAAVLDPGMAAIINGGSFYKLENSGKGPMIMMGWRTGSEEQCQTIDYATGEKIVFDGSRRVVKNKYEDAAAQAAE